MRLPQFVYIAGPTDAAARLAARIVVGDATRLEVDLDEAVEEFQLLFVPTETLDHCVDLLYRFDQFAIGNAGVKLFKARTENDPDAAAVVYPIRRHSDYSAFTGAYASTNHLLINMDRGVIPGLTYPPIPTLTFSATGNTDADYAALQAEFASSMRATT